MLGIGEVAGVDVKDVFNEFTVQSSKTDQKEHGESLYIGDNTRRAIRKYANRVAETWIRSLFRRIRRGGHITVGRLEDPKMPAHYASSQIGARLQGSNMGSEKIGGWSTSDVRKS